EVLQPLQIGYKVSDDGQKILLYPLDEKKITIQNSSTPEEAIVNDADIIVSGTVTNEMGLPMPGVSVNIKGESTGTVTDMNGVFKIKVADKNTTLVISNVGYQTQEIIVGNKTAVTIKLVQ